MNIIVIIRIDNRIYKKDNKNKVINAIETKLQVIFEASVNTVRRQDTIIGNAIGSLRQRGAMHGALYK